MNVHEINNTKMNLARTNIIAQNMELTHFHCFHKFTFRQSLHLQTLLYMVKHNLCSIKRTYKREQIIYKASLGKKQEMEICKIKNRYVSASEFSEKLHGLVG